MSRALPVVLAAAIVAGTAGATLLPTSAHPGRPQVSALSVDPVRPISSTDWTTAGMYAGQAAAARQAQLAQAAAQAALARQAAQAQRDRAAQAQARASRSRPVQVSYGSPREIAQSMLAQRGWSGQFGCLDSLWNRESGWSTYASNPSGAYGIPQALPGSKMASAGADWRTNPATQIRWGLGYIAGTYGSPCGAWAHSQSYGWY